MSRPAAAKLESLDWAQPPEPHARTRAADHVFEAVAGAILQGKLAPDDALPPERELAVRFDISRVLVREAIHKLKELGLVRVRQGGQTIVLDPELSTDPRVTMLNFELAAPMGAVVRDMAERQNVQGMVLLELAEPRCVTANIDELDKTIDDYEAAGPEAAGMFIMQFWTTVAKATQNQILLRETRFWFQLAARRTGGTPPGLALTHEERIAMHRGVTERLRRRGGAADFYMSIMRKHLAR
jgi:GntR family transcriptional regulator, transcriptional repressor for pyruvate dehydrogenase complex